MKKFILSLFLILFVIVGCNKKENNVTMDELKQIQETIQEKLEQLDYYNGISSFGIDTKEMVVVVEFVVNDEEHQKWFRENISDSKYIEFKQGGPYTTSSNDVSLKIKPNTLSKKGATFILKNNTDKEYWYGEAWSVEKLENGNWKEFETLTGDPLTWNAIAYTLKANEEKEIVIDWSYGYGELEDGEYRLVKSTFKEEDRPIDESKKLYLYAEFIIKSNNNKKIGIVKNENQNLNKFSIYLEKDERVVYISSALKEIYLIGEVKETLKNYISTTWQTTEDGMNSITDLLNNTETLRDGGTKIYKSKEYDITIIKCNTILGNRDYFIGDYNMNFDNDSMCKR